MALFNNPSDDNRPVFLDLTKIALPVTALVSILHRVSGVGMILGLPIMIAMMYATVAGGVYHTYLTASLNYTLVKIVLLLIVTGTGYHILAGIRHSFDDFIGSHSLRSARVSAWAILLLWLVWVALCVRRLWF